MKKLKYIIIGLVISLIILIILLIGILNKRKESERVDDLEDGSIPQDTLVEMDKYTVKETNDNMFFTINDIIQQSLKTNQKDYYAQEMYRIQTYDRATYYTYGLLKEEGKEKLQDYYLKIRMDNNNYTFEIEPLDIREYNTAKEGKINTIENTEIKKTKDNQYEMKSISSEEIARRYIKDYILKIKYMQNTAFDLLDSTYKNKKFRNIEEFKSYIEKNSNRFDNFIMQKYQCEVQENLLEYTVLDRYENCYKILVYDTLNYKMILDDYTDEDAEYLEEYKNAKETDKVATCISKFIKQINAKEYTQAYQYLEETFKKNNFNTVEKFEKYIKSYLFDYNIETIKSAEKYGDVYSCKVNIKSGVGVSAEEKDITIMIKLLEDTKFVMSFNVK